MQLISFLQFQAAKNDREGFVKYNLKHKIQCKAMWVCPLNMVCSVMNVQNSGIWTSGRMQ